MTRTTAPTTATALIADDEPLLRDALRVHLATLWPELRVVAEARNGVDAVDSFERQHPSVCFLDIHMPGLDGVEVARRIGGRAHVVFVTAYDHYAVQAFEQGALDYVVKPLQPDRLRATVARLRERLARHQGPTSAEDLLRELGARLASPALPHLKWIKADTGGGVRLIAVDDIDYFRSDEKYTLIAWRGDGGQAADALVRTPLKALVDQLDPTCFQQVHRSVVVNLAAVARVVNDGERALIHLKRRSEVLPVSRTFAAFFKAQ